MSNQTQLFPTAIIYIRVSTEDQTISPRKQEADLRAYCEQQGWAVVDVVKEVASGKDNDRLGLADAAVRCAGEGHKLVIKRIDRLSRRLSKVAELLENPNLEIVCSETGPVNPMVLAMLAVVAAEEARLIAERTSAALQQRKAEGQLLGYALHSEEIRAKAVKRSIRTRTNRADKHARLWGGVIKHLMNEGKSWAQICRELERMKAPTSASAAGKPKKYTWVPASISRVMKRYNRLVSADGDDLI